jgi:hypothetical protein
MDKSRHLKERRRGRISGTKNLQQGEVLRAL